MTALRALQLISIAQGATPEEVYPDTPASQQKAEQQPRPQAMKQRVDAD